MNFNMPMDTSTIICYYLNLWSQKVSLTNSEIKYAGLIVYTGLLFVIIMWPTEF